MLSALNIETIGIKYLLKLLCFFLILLCSCKPASAQAFEPYIRNFKKEQMPEAAEKYGRSYILNDTSAAALQKCDSIIAYAERTGNQELLSVARRIKGTYYTRVHPDYLQATTNLRQSLEIAEKYHLGVQKAKALHQLGYTYYLNNDLQKALGSFLLADHLMKEIGYERIYDISRHLYNLALVFSNLYNIDNSNTYLRLAIQYGSDREAIMAAYNNLGQNYKVQKKYDTALLYCKKSLEYAIKLGDSLRFGIICGNIGDIYVKTDSIATGKFYLNTAEQLCLKYGDYQQSTMASMGLAELEYRDGSYSRVKLRLDKAGAIIRKYNFRRNEEVRLDYYRLCANMYRLEGLYAQAAAVQDSIIKIKEANNAAEEISMLKNIETGILVEKFNADLLLSESVRKREKIFLVGGLLIAVLATIIIYLSYSKKLQEKKQNLNILQLKQKNVENELLHAQEGLNNYVHSLKEKNTLIEDLKMELDKISSRTLLSNSEKEEVVQKMLQSTILTEKDWNEFKTTFEKVHTHFFANILKRYPTLSMAELRILSLFKLRLSVDEMAGMLGVSPDSVKRTCRRIRTKTDLPHQIALENMVAGM